MIKILKQNWMLIVVESLILVLFCIFKGHYGDVIIDSFREAYLPQQILNGKVLYKDIFCIYPPLAYIFNALLYKIFGVNLNVLYGAGLILTLGIFYFTHKICKLFFDNLLTFAIALFMAAALVLSPNVFNPFFPYSYGILYGLFFILGSVYFGLNQKFPLAYLFYSISICCKYEFILFLPILIFISGRKDWVKNLACLITPPMIVTGLLFIQGLNLESVKAAMDLIKYTGEANTLHYFYSSMGLLFRWELIPVYITNLIKFILPFDWNHYQEILIWIFPTIVLLFVFKYKTLSKTEKIFIGSSLLISAKVFFALVLQSYGVFFIPFGLIALFILLPKRITKYASIVLLIWAIIIGIKNSQALLNKNTELLSNYGTIKTTQHNAFVLNDVINYTKTLPENYRVAVYPECLSINYISNKKSDNKLYSLIPLYVEAFGEDLILNRLNLFPPECIIINNYDTSAYFFKTFGEDYGNEIYKWVKENYKQEKVFGTDFKFYIYLKK